MLARQVCRHPKWFVAPQILLFVLSVFYTASHWKLDMDRDDLVAGPTHQVYMEFRKKFPGEDELAVVVQSGDMERNRQFVERLAARLEPETNCSLMFFTRATWRRWAAKRCCSRRWTN